MASSTLDHSGMVQNFKSIQTINSLKINNIFHQQMACFPQLSIYVNLSVSRLYKQDIGKGCFFRIIELVLI